MLSLRLKKGSPRPTTSDAPIVKYVNRLPHASSADIYPQGRPGQPFWDTSSQLSPFLSTLPDVLRIKPNGLSYQQTRVYDEFGKGFFLLLVSRF